MHRRGGGGGARSHPSIVSSGWWLSTLRLLWDISRDWTLHHGCGRRQSRRCLGTLSQRVVCGSVGSARDISGRRTGLNPRPITMSSARTNHGGRLGRGRRKRDVRNHRNHRGGEPPTGRQRNHRNREVRQGRLRRVAGAAQTCG